MNVRPDKRGPQFSELLRAYRVRAGVSQEDLAERAGISAKAVGALESGRRRAPYRETVTLLAKALSLSDVEAAQLENTAARARLRTAAPLLLSGGPQKNNLPAQVTSFVGRERELEDVARLLGRHRLLTVTGFGGLGKTRLALEGASRLKGEYGDGVWLVELASVNDERSVISKIRDALSLSSAEADPVGAVVTGIGQRRLLLLLDNCEHVLGHVTGIVQRVLRGCPNVAVMATSRERLSLSGEVTYRIPTLSVPPARRLTAAEAMSYSAIKLFAERAELADPHFMLTDEHVPLVATICRKLEGIALAIEIAAARLPALGLQSLRRRLDDRLTLLASQFVDSPERQSTLAATLQWSYDLLSEDERRIFRQLSVFVRGFTVDAAAAIIPQSELEIADVPTHLNSLVDKSLLSVETGNDGVRYWFLEATRDFANHKLIEYAEQRDVAERFVRWAATFAASLGQSRYRISEQVWHRQATTEFDNVYAALLTALEIDGDASMAGRIVGSLRVHWYNAGRGAEALRLATALLDRLDAERYPTIAAGLLLTKANSLVGQPRLSAVLQARDFLTRARDAAGLIHCYLSLAWAYLIRGNTSKASESVGHAWTFAVLDGRQGPNIDAPLLYLRGVLLERQGEIQKAREIFLAGAKAANTSGEEATKQRMRTSVAEMDFCLGRVREALDVFEELIDDETWYRAHHVYLQLRAAACLIMLDELSQAEDLVRSALQSADEFVLFTTEAIQHLAHIALRRGDPARAARLVGFNDRRLREADLHRDSFERTCYKALVLELRNQLCDDERATQESAGAQLTLEEASAQALMS